MTIELKNKSAKRSAVDDPLATVAQIQQAVADFYKGEWTFILLKGKGWLCESYLGRSNECRIHVDELIITIYPTDTNRIAVSLWSPESRDNVVIQYEHELYAVKELLEPYYLHRGITRYL